MKKCNAKNSNFFVVFLSKYCIMRTRIVPNRNLTITPMNPEQSAGHLLEAVWRDRGFPVDPITISRALGLRVMQASLPAEVSGAIIKKAGNDPVIMLEVTDSDNRKRFTCAHELGHFVYRTEGRHQEEAFEWLDFRDPSSSMGTETEEIFANGFAAALLMPEKAVRARWTLSQSVPLLAAYFSVSAESVGWRLNKLGLKPA
jgi:Zn-dependent peptidase ImmA (M78 family)